MMSTTNVLIGQYAPPTTAVAIAILFPILTPAFHEHLVNTKVPVLSAGLQDFRIDPDVTRTLSQDGTP